MCVVLKIKLIKYIKNEKGILSATFYRRTRRGVNSRQENEAV